MKRSRASSVAPAAPRALSFHSKKIKCDFGIMVHEWMSHVLRYEKLPATFDVDVIRDLLVCLSVMRDVDARPHAHAVLQLTLHALTTSWLVWMGAFETIVRVLRANAAHAYRVSLLASVSAMVPLVVFTPTTLPKIEIEQTVRVALSDACEPARLYALHTARNLFRQTKRCTPELVHAMVPFLFAESVTLRTEAATALTAAARTGYDLSAADVQTNMLAACAASVDEKYTTLLHELLECWFLVLGWNDRKTFVGLGGFQWLLDLLVSDSAAKTREKTMMVLSHFVQTDVGGFSLDGGAVAETKRMLLGRNLVVAMHAARFLSHFCGTESVRGLLSCPEVAEWMRAWMRTPRLVRIPDMHRYVARLMVAARCADVDLLLAQLESQLDTREPLGHETIKELVRATLYAVKAAPAPAPAPTRARAVAAVCSAARVSAPSRRWCWRLLAELARHDATFRLRDVAPDVVLLAMRGVFEDPENETDHARELFGLAPLDPKTKTKAAAKPVAVVDADRATHAVDAAALVRRVPYFSFLEREWADSATFPLRIPHSTAATRRMLSFVASGTVAPLRDDDDDEAVARECLVVSDFYCMDDWKHRIEWELIKLTISTGDLRRITAVAASVAPRVETPFVHTFLSICL